MNAGSVSDQLQSQNGNRFGKAIVMGAGIAGLWTARALSDLFEEVLILERDQLPEGADFRPGVPQGRQFHTLLLSGLKQMKEWFPGLDEELIAAGAVPYDATNDIRIQVRGHWCPRFPSGWILLSCSRMLLESGIRRRLSLNPCVRFIAGVEVIGLQTDAGKRGVTGVRIRNRRGGSVYQESDPVFNADLVVDALGRSSPTPEWLVGMGYHAPLESEVDSFLGYVTRIYKRKPGTPLLAIGGIPPENPYAGVIFPQENDTTIVMLGGYNKHYPPTDPEEFDQFIQTMGPEFRDALAGAEPVSQPYAYRGTANRWRHYEQLERWPERFVVIGDAFCGFNPIYGQGMSVAAMSAVALANRIRKSKGNLDGVASSTLKEISKITQSIWLLATSADLEWPGTQGGTLGNSPVDRLGRWYIDKVMDTVPFDKEVWLTFIAISQLIKPATALFAPEIFLRVMRHTLRSKKQG